MELQFKHLLLSAALLFAVLTNPSEMQHRQSTAQAAQAERFNLLLRILLDQDDLQAHFIYHNYWLFSFTEYKGRVITIGLLQNVHVIYPNLYDAQRDYSTLFPQ